MDYVTTGSSNSVTSEGPFELEINISQNPSNPILLMGTFTIENLSNIAADEDLQNLSCELFGKTNDVNGTTTPLSISEFSYDDKSPGTLKCILPRGYCDEYIYIILKINGPKCTIHQPPATELKIIFKDKNNTDDNQKAIENIILFNVLAQTTKPEIISFDASPTVLQGNNQKVTLTWDLKAEKYILREGLRLLKSGKEGPFEFTIKPVPIGNHTYTLEVKQGDVSVTKSLQVRALEFSTLGTCLPPTSSTIGNFCVSQNSERLFSLMLSTNINSSKAQIDHIGYTNEGFSGQWSKIGLSDDEKKNLKPFATSPMVHLKNTGEVYGRLLFIGGSCVKPMECSNSVAILDLDWESGTGSGARLKFSKDLPWSPRMGHSCAIFTHGGEDKIWLLGGVDEWGSAQNDVWVSGDGIKWNNIDKAGVVSANKNSPVAMDWDARCLAGISVELDDQGNKKALWFGGGFSEIGGKETPDIWKFEETLWSMINLTINNGSYLSSGLAFIGKDTINSTGTWLLGGYVEMDNKKNKKSFFYRLTLETETYGTDELFTFKGESYFTTNKNAKIITAYFKGCLWAMVFTNEGYLGITYSSLFYWVPVVQEKTLILT